MSTAPDFTADHQFVAKGVLVSTWSSAVSGIGSVLDAPNLADKTVQLSGPAVTGTSSARIMGSNFGPSGPWTILEDPLGNDLILAAGNAIEVILENPRYIRPEFTTVTGITMKVVIVSKERPR